MVHTSKNFKAKHKQYEIGLSVIYLSNYAMEIQKGDLCFYSTQPSLS